MLNHSCFSFQNYSSAKIRVRNSQVFNCNVIVSSCENEERHRVVNSHVLKDIPTDADGSLLNCLDDYHTPTASNIQELVVLHFYLNLVVSETALLERSSNLNLLRRVSHQSVVYCIVVNRDKVYCVTSLTGKVLPFKQEGSINGMIHSKVLKVTVPYYQLAIAKNSGHELKHALGSSNESVVLIQQLVLVVHTGALGS